MINKILWVFLEKGSATIIQFLSLIVLSRFLTPEDYGTYGVMMIFISLSDTIVDSGFGAALVQKKCIKQKDLNTLFFTNAICSILLYAILFFCSPFLEELYNIKNLTIYFRAIGLVIIFYAFSIVQNAMVLRELRFRFSATINLLSSVLSVSVAIMLAYCGYGVWALVFQTLSHSIISTIILWIKSKIKLTFDLSKDSFLVFLKFGSNLLGANILQTIVNNISNNIIPKIGTLQQAGIYFQAAKLNSVPINILTQSIDKSIFPILSRQTDKNALLGQARRLNQYFFTFIIPVFPLISYFSYPIVTIVLGEKWIDVTNYLSIIIWSGIALTFQCLSRNIIKSIGLTKYILMIEFLKSSITLIVILISMHFGVVFLVWGTMGASYIGALIWSIWLKKEAGYKYSEQILDTYKALIQIFIVYISLFLLNINAYRITSLVYLPTSYLLYLYLGFILKNTAIVGAIDKFKTLKNKVK